MSSLLSCDSYSLDFILEYVSGGSILRLLLCGSPTLSANILSSCTKLCLSWSGLGRSRWPSLIAHFRQLIEFRYANVEDIRWLPCVDVKIEHLPKSLKRLTLSYFDPVSSLFTGSVLPDNTLHYTSLDYSTYFPHLETLKLYSKVALVPSVYALFPASLTDLYVECYDNFDGSAMLPYLPRGLKSLSIGTMQACDEEERWKHFPPNLESLSLFFENQRSIWVQHIPPSVTSLKVHVFGENRERYMQVWPILPRTLKHLLFYGDSEQFDLELYSQLPPSLETLSWTVDMAPPQVEHYNSAAEFALALEAYDALVGSIFSHHPSSLTSLDFDNLVFCEKTLQSCPWHCREASIRNSSDFSESSLSMLSTGAFASLTSLDILKGALSVEIVGALPKTIETLTIRNVSNSIAIALGKRLNSLETLTCISGSLSPSGASGLPQSITSMSLDYTVLESLECLKELPKRLKSLSFSVLGNIDLDESSRRGAIEDDNASYFMPASITQLSVFTPRALSEVWFKGLALHPSLLELIATYTSGVSSTVFSYMPKQIRGICMNIQFLYGEELKNLPRTVRLLDACGLSETRIKDEHLALLPENIYYLSISAQCGLSESSAKFLPKDLLHLYVDWGQPAWFANDFDQFSQSRTLEPDG